MHCGKAIAFWYEIFLSAVVSSAFCTEYLIGIVHPASRISSDNTAFALDLNDVLA